MDSSHDRRADRSAPASETIHATDSLDASGASETGRLDAATKVTDESDALGQEPGIDDLDSDRDTDLDTDLALDSIDDEIDDLIEGQGDDGDIEAVAEIVEDADRADESGGSRISSVPTDPRPTSSAVDPVLPVRSDPRSPGLAQASALTAYMSQLRNHAPITREEEHELAVRWSEDGDVDAAKLLVMSNLRLVVKIAMEYRRAWTNTLDLIQEGNVGLMEAVQRFDPYQGVKLSSYAVYWIRAYVLKYILDNMRSVRLGTTRASRKLFFRLNKEKRELERLGYEAEPRLLAERLDVSEADVTDMEALLARPDVAFDAPLRSDESGGMTFGDRMEAGGISAEAAVGGHELREVFLEQISTFAETLNERDRQILDERVLAEEPRTLAELGEEFDVSRERVRQLEAKIIKRLRDFMQANLVDFEYYGPDGG